MKHWGGEDSDGATAVALDQRELAALARVMPVPVRRRARPRVGLGSLVGLGLSLAFLAGLAIALAPTSPVARELRR